MYVVSILGLGEQCNTVLKGSDMPPRVINGTRLFAITKT
jgi:hypothetical protein